MNSNAYGIFSKVPPEERLVAEERDCWAHARAARELPFPERLPGTELGPVILRAIDIIIDLGPDLERNKRDRRALRPSGRGLGGVAGVAHRGTCHVRRGGGSHASRDSRSCITFPASWRPPHRTRLSTRQPGHTAPGEGIGHGIGNPIRSVPHGMGS